MITPPPLRLAKPLQAGMLQVGTLNVHHTYGGKGSPVVFIHGLGSSGYLEWRFNLNSTAVRHRVFAPDLPGFGRTEKPRVRYGVPYFTRFIERYMDARGLHSAAIVGTSLGGRIALELALTEPKRVKRLVLVNTLGLGRPAMRLSYGLITLPRVGETVMRVTKNALQWAPARMIRRVAGRYAGATADLNLTMDDGYLDDLREMHSQQGFHDAYLATVRSLVTPRAFFAAEYDVSRRLPEIKVPLQLIWGADDPLFPVAHARRAHGLAPDSRLAVIEGAGHTPQAERPEEFNRVLHEFLAQ